MLPDTDAGGPVNGSPMPVTSLIVTGSPTVSLLGFEAALTLPVAVSAETARQREVHGGLRCVGIVVVPGTARSGRRRCRRRSTDRTRRR